MGQSASSCLVGRSNPVSLLYPLCLACASQSHCWTPIHDDPPQVRQNVFLHDPTHHCERFIVRGMQQCCWPMQPRSVHSSPWPTSMRGKRGRNLTHWLGAISYFITTALIRHIRVPAPSHNAGSYWQICWHRQGPHDDVSLRLRHHLCSRAGKY